MFLASNMLEEPKTESPEDLVSSFFSMVKNRSEYTAKNYVAYFHRIKCDPVDLLKQTLERPKATERYLFDWITREVNTRAPSTILQTIMSIKSFLETCGVPEGAITWRRLNSLVPKRPRGTDRAVLASEVRLIHDGKRQRFLNCLFYSSGIREGAAYYAVRPKEKKHGRGYDYLRIKDLQRIVVGGVTIGKLIVYRGDIEEYITFTTPECLEAFDEYVKERESEGEKVGPDSPLIRWERRPSVSFASLVNPIRPNSISHVYDELWRKAGLEERNFKAVKSFRKAFKSNLEDSGMKSLYVEMLLGHFYSAYYRPDQERISEMKLAKEYVQHMSSLYVSEVPKLKDEVVSVKKDMEEKENKWYIQAKKMEEAAKKKDLEFEDLKLIMRLERQYRTERSREKKSEILSRIEEIDSRLA